MPCAPGAAPVEPAGMAAITWTVLGAAETPAGWNAPLVTG